MEKNMASDEGAEDQGRVRRCGCLRDWNQEPLICPDIRCKMATS